MAAAPNTPKLAYYIGGHGGIPVTKSPPTMFSCNIPPGCTVVLVGEIGQKKLAKNQVRVFDKLIGNATNSSSFNDPRFDNPRFNDPSLQDLPLLKQLFDQDVLLLFPGNPCPDIQINLLTWIPNHRLMATGVNGVIPFTKIRNKVQLHALCSEDIRTKPFFQESHMQYHANDFAVSGIKETSEPNDVNLYLSGLFTNSSYPTETEVLNFLLKRPIVKSDLVSFNPYTFLQEQAQRLYECPMMNIHLSKLLELGKGTFYFNSCFDVTDFSELFVLCDSNDKKSIKFVLPNSERQAIMSGQNNYLKQMLKKRNQVEMMKGIIRDKGAKNHVTNRNAYIKRQMNNAGLTPFPLLRADLHEVHALPSLHELHEQSRIQYETARLAFQQNTEEIKKYMGRSMGRSMGQSMGQNPLQSMFTSMAEKMSSQHQPHTKTSIPEFRNGISNTVTKYGKHAHKKPRPGPYNRNGGTRKKRTHRNI
jgi:hypothetical protein